MSAHRIDRSGPLPSSLEDYLLRQKFAKAKRSHEDGEEGEVVTAGKSGDTKVLVQGEFVGLILPRPAETHRANASDED